MTTLAEEPALDTPAISPATSRWDVLALGVMVSLVVAKAVLPPFAAMLAVGRPLPGTALELTGTASALGQTLTLAIVVVAAYIVLSRNSSLDRSLVGPSWLVYLTAAAIASWNAGYVPLGTVLTSAAVLVAAMHLALDSDAAARVLVVVLGAVTVACVLLHLIDPDLARFGSDLYAEPGRGSRVAGILEQPNQLGLIAGLTTVAAVVVMRQRRTAFLGSVALAIGAIGLYLSESYTSWLASLVGVGVAFFVPYSHAVRPSARLIRFGLAAAACVALAVVIVRTIRADTMAGTVSGRQLVWNFVDSHWLERPLLGHGVGVWSDLTSTGSLPPWAVHAHDQVLNTLYVGGVLTVAALVVAVLWSAVRSVRGWRRGLGLCAGLLGFQLIRSYSEVPFELLFAGLNLVVPLTLIACRRDDYATGQDVT